MNKERRKRLDDVISQLEEIQAEVASTQKKKERHLTICPKVCSTLNVANR